MKHRKKRASRRIPVRIVQTGQEFESIKECAEHLKVNPVTLTKLLKLNPVPGSIEIERIGGDEGEDFGADWWLDEG